MDVTRYRQIIGLLMYLTNTRPEICFAVNTLSQSRRVHLVAAKHVMRYLKGTIDFGLYYDGSHEYILDRKSTLGICFCLGSAMSSWFSRKQSIVSRSMAEAEYIAD